jgi:hypothetical protein
VLTIALTCLGAAVHAQSVSTPAETLRRAFDARYRCAITGIVQIDTRKGEAAAQTRRMEVATKAIGGRLHTYAVFREPPHVRGVAFLGIEAKDAGGSEERFVYLPSLRKIRRVSGSQSEDAFLGTDLSYHDFERQREESYEVRLGGEARVDGEPASIVLARPRSAAGYERVEHAIASADHAILRTRYFKHGSDEAYKQLVMDRAHIVEHGECRVPTRIVVEDSRRGTSTTLEVSALRLDAQLPDDLFSMVALETKRPIPGIR